MTREEMFDRFDELVDELRELGYAVGMPMGGGEIDYIEDADGNILEQFDDRIPEEHKPIFQELEEIVEAISVS